MRIHIPSLIATAAIVLLVPASTLAQSAAPAPSTPADSSSPSAHAPFEGTRWHLREFQAEDGGTAGASEGAWLAFADGRLIGSTGCNDLAATYALDGTALSINDLTPAEPSCGSDVIAQEMAMLANLPQVTSIAFEDARDAYATNLALIDGFGGRPLVFVAIEHRRWTPLYSGTTTDRGLSLLGPPLGGRRAPGDAAPAR